MAASGSQWEDVCLFKDEQWYGVIGVQAKDVAWLYGEEDGVGGRRGGRSSLA